MGDALHTHGGVTDAREARLAQAGLIAVQGPTSIDARTGVLAGPGTLNLVTGTSSTAPMLVSIAAHQWVTSRGGANGPYLGALEAPATVAIAAAPASGTRIDVVYVKQQDATPGVPTPDETTAPLYGAITGTVGAGKPQIPLGGLELATVTVSAGATRTNGSGVVIANTAKPTVARGGILPVRSTDSTAGAYAGDYRDHPTSRLQRWNGSAWESPVPPIPQPVWYSGNVLPASRADGTNITASTINIDDPGFAYRLVISAALALGQNISDARIDLRVYIGTTLVSATTKSTKTITDIVSVEHPARIFPATSAAGYTGARTVYLRVNRVPAGATAAYAVEDDPVINHFTVQVVPA